MSDGDGARERADRCVESILAGHRAIIRLSGNEHEEGLEDDGDNSGEAPSVSYGRRP